MGLAGIKGLQNKVNSAGKNVVVYSTNPSVATMINYSGNITLNELHKAALKMSIG